MIEKLNAKVLGQLLLMQSFIINLPDKRSIFNFICRGFIDIPGVLKANYHEEKQDINDPCLKSFPIVLGKTFYGELVLTLSDYDLFEPYTDYLNNFVFMLSVILEERNHRQIDIEHQQLLEQRILERTQELLREKEKLIESERRFSDMMKNVRLLSVMLDKDGCIIFCNKHLLSETRYTEDEVLGKKWIDLFLSPEVAKKITVAFQNAMAGNLIDNLENEILTKTGEKLLIRWNNTVLFDANKQIVGTASIGENITMRKRAEEALIKKNTEYKDLNEEYSALNEELTESLENLQNINRQLEIAKEKAEESDRLKTAFLQNMSHEIRTPMNAIMGFSSLLTNCYNNKSKLEQFSGIITQRCNDLLDIINDILDISKIESGQLTLHYDHCNLQELFGELTTFFYEYQVKIGKKSINFRLLPCNDPAINQIITDKGKLKQIFINLLSNAFKFTDQGEIIGGCKFENNTLTFFVTDTGIGIPPDKHDIIFERFSQLKQGSKKNVGGTGLGLPIVKGLVSMLGGKIIVESEPGKGSTFLFTIPINSMQIPLKTVTVEKSDKYNFSNKTVLIVEDDYFNAEYLKEVLTVTGFQVLTTQLGSEACKIAVENNPDIILMDIRLPDIDGYEATRLIRQENKKVKIIAQTAYVSTDESKKAISAGCNDYLSKPTNKDKLLKMINNLLQE